jgi:hypothetical protein
MSTSVMWRSHGRAARQMAVRSSVGRRGKGVNVGRPDVSGVGAVSDERAFPSNSPSPFILGDERNEAFMVET